MNYSNTVNFIKSLYPDETPVPLHAPRFTGNEKLYLADCIDSTFVSYVGKYVTAFEEYTAKYSGAGYAFAVVNGTAGLFIALKLAGADQESEVITQALTFVATVNAIAYTGAAPVFIDVDLSTMGMSAAALKSFISNSTALKNGFRINKNTGKKISAVMPMHTFGHPCDIEEIQTVCAESGITLIEDCAESLGSLYKNIHTGKFGSMAVFSFNGNKTVTTGGGGMVITDSKELAIKGRYITTTAKRPHPYEFFHDELGYNYRMPNLNAAVGLAQMEKLDDFLENKRQTAKLYKEHFIKNGINFFCEQQNCKSNYWLNAVILKNREERDEFLNATNSAGVMTRPVWKIMTELPMYKNCVHDGLVNSLWLSERVVNIPSSVRKV